jgi:hypothetical protein
LKDKAIKSVLVTYDQFTEWDFIPVGSFYIRIATGDYLFIKTSDRAAAQKFVNEEYGKGKYTVVASKIQKTASKLESGGFSCTGTATRQVKR